MSFAFLDIEAVIEDVRDALVAGLPTAIAAINSAATDGVALADIAAGSYWTHMPDIKLGRGDFDYPAIAIVDEGVSPTEDSNCGFYTQRYSVIVDVLVRGESPADVTCRTRRYAKAIAKVLAPRASALNGSGRMCDFVSSSTHRATDPESGDFLQDIAQRYVITQGEATA